VKPLRIAIFTPTFLPKFSGAEIFHHNLASHLAAAGHQPTVIMPRPRYRQLGERGWHLPYATESYPGNFWSYFKYSAPLAFWLNRWALIRLQRRHRFEVWHAVVLFPAGVCLVDWQRRSRVPGLLRPVGDDVKGLPGEGHSAQVHALLRSKLPSAQAVIALSSGMAEDLESLGVEATRIFRIPNAVDARRLARPADRTRQRAAAGLPDEAFVFLCVARNHPQKDFPTLFAAFRQLLERTDHPVFLAIAGRGAPGLQAQAAAAGVGERVKFFEFGMTPGETVPRTPPQGLVDLYHAADAFVLSSLLEGFSSALVEAMAAGLPVVATDAPGIHEVLVDGDTALLSPCGDPVALSASLQRIVRDADLRQSLATAARDEAAIYDWPAVTTAYVDLYRKLIAEWRPSRV